MKYVINSQEHPVGKVKDFFYRMMIARMIAIIVEKSPNSSHMYDHGFMDNANRQAVKNRLDSQTRVASLTWAYI